MGCISERRNFSMYFNERNAFVDRIRKTLYYNKLSLQHGFTLPVSEVAAEIFTEVKKGQSLERLDIEKASNISLDAYVSPCSLVLALLYLERLKDCNPKYLKRITPSELFVVSLMVANKFMNDEGIDDVLNDDWAHAANLTLAKVNRLEKEFLKAIDWTVYVHKQEFWKRFLRLEKDVAYNEGRKRGWFSYTELRVLLGSVHLTTLLQTVLSTSFFCMAVYMMGLASLLGSVAVATHLPGLLDPKCESNFEDVDSTPLDNERLQPSNDLSHDTFTNSSVCNESCHNFDILNNEMKKRLENTIVIPDLYLDEWHKEFDKNNIFVTNTDYLNDIDKFTSWRETLSLSLHFPIQDWNYISKMTLGH